MRTVPAGLVAAAVLVSACTEATSPPDPGTDVAVDVSRCSATVKPPWFAFQDGPDGMWAGVAAAGDRFEFAVHGEKFGYAWVAPTAPYGPFVRYTTLGELTANPIMLCNGVGSTTAAVANIAGGRAYVSFGGALGNTTVEGGLASLTSIRDGVHDALASLQGGTTSGRLILRRDVTPAAGTLGAFDFGSAEAFAPDTATLTVAGDFGDNVTYSMSYRTGAACLLGRLPAGSTGAMQLLGVPAGRQVATDYHVVDAVARGLAGGSNFRWVTLYHHALADRFIAFGPYLSGATVTVLPGPYLRLEFAGDLPPELDTYVVASYGGASVRATIAYLTDVAETLAMPDLSGVAGWQNAWGPLAGSGVMWVVQAAHVSGAVCSEGAITIGASLEGNS